MAARFEITGRYADQYARASKKERGQILDEVVAVTGWSRDNARRRLTAAVKDQARAAPKSRGRRAVSEQARRPRSFKYSYDARKVLARVWAVSQGQCGKYLVVSMPLLLETLETHGEMVFGQDRYSPEVKAELLMISAATIDRYLKPVKDAGRLKVVGPEVCNCRT